MNHFIGRKFINLHRKWENFIIDIKDETLYALHYNLQREYIITELTTFWLTEYEDDTIWKEIK